MKKAYIGLDIGGMSFKGGVVNESGEILFEDKAFAQTDCEEGNKNFLTALKELIIRLKDKAVSEGYEILGIGAGVPGFVNNEKGTIDYCTNLRLFNVNVKDHLKDLNIPFYMSNDANVAALAEQKFGCAKGHKNVVLITLGTGIGSGIIIDNKIYEGNNAQGGEIGHMVIVVDGKSCNCGRKGCFERYASARALIEDTKTFMEKDKSSYLWKMCEGDINKVSGRMSWEAAKMGDKLAEEIINNYIHYLGEGLLNVCNIFRPEVIVLGGGISNQKDYLIDKVNKYFEEHHYGMETCCKVEVKCANYANEAGIIGAACLCF